MDRVVIAFAALSGLLAVAAGAYASHGVADTEAVRLMEIAGRFQMWHALALLAVGLLVRLGGSPPRLALLGVAASGFSAGLVLFCGSLYALALGAPPLDFGLAPVGGTAFMVGWLALAGSMMFSGRR